MFNLLGLSLQAFGIIIGGLGVVAERFLDYLPMQTLASRRVQIYFANLNVTAIPFLRAITQTPELETGRDDRYNKWEVMIVLFIVLLIALPIVAIVYFIPVIYIYRFYIPLFVLSVWIGLSIVVDVLPAILLSALPPERVSQPIPKVPLQFHLPRVNLQRYIRLQLRYFFLTPLQHALVLMILLSQIILNWFAWVIRLNLAGRELRGRYYALYSLSALLLGTIFLIIALF